MFETYETMNCSVMGGCINSTLEELCFGIEANLNTNGETREPYRAVTESILNNTTILCIVLSLYKKFFIFTYSK